MREMLNMTVLTGRLTADPELKHTENHIPYTRFTLAVDRPYAKKGEERETDFIDIAAWRRQAEFACRHFLPRIFAYILGPVHIRPNTHLSGKFCRLRR